MAFCGEPHWIAAKLFKEMKSQVDEKTPSYSAAITREQFLFREGRIVASLFVAGFSRDEIVEKCVNENLFQMPTLKSIRSIARACCNRLDFVGKKVVEIISDGPSNEAKLAWLYAYMCQNLIVRDFMVDIIGPKYRIGALVFERGEVSRFVFDLSNRVAAVAKCSDATLKKVQSVLLQCLVNAGYLTTFRSNELLPVNPSDELIRAIELDGNDYMLSAFNAN